MTANTQNILWPLTNDCYILSKKALFVSALLESIDVIMFVDCNAARFLLITD